MTSNVPQIAVPVAASTIPVVEMKPEPETCAHCSKDNSDIVDEEVDEDITKPLINK